MTTKASCRWSPVSACSCSCSSLLPPPPLLSSSSSSSSSFWLPVLFFLSLFLFSFFIIIIIYFLKGYLVVGFPEHERCGAPWTIARQGLPPLVHRWCRKKNGLWDGRARKTERRRRQCTRNTLDKMDTAASASEKLVDIAVDGLHGLPTAWVIWWQSIGRGLRTVSAAKQQQQKEEERKKNKKWE